jgi:membrane protein required for colicin V production
MVMGFIKGFTKQAFAVVGLILGIILGTLFYKPFADFLRETMNMPDRPASIMAFFIILLVVPLICGVLGNLLSKLIHIASLGFIDRLLGAAFGLLKYLLIMGLIIMLLDMTGYSDKIINRTERRQSKMYVYVRNVTSFCLQWTWDKIQDSAEELVPELKNKRNNSTGSSNHKSV